MTRPSSVRSRFNISSRRTSPIGKSYFKSSSGLLIKMMPHPAHPVIGLITALTSPVSSFRSLYASNKCSTVLHWYPFATLVTVVPKSMSSMTEEIERSLICL